jgi:hypothetical protein
MQELLLYQVDGQVIDNQQDQQVLKGLVEDKVHKEHKVSKVPKEDKGLKVFKVLKER